MPSLLEDSRSNISIISRGSSTETSQHRYFTRSSVRKYRSPFSINCQEPQVRLTPLKDLGTGCGDVHLQLQHNLSSNSSQQLDTHNPVTQKPMDNVATNVCLTRLLKICIFVGIAGLLITNMVDHFIFNNVTMNTIKVDLEDMKKEIRALDSKVNQVLGDGQNSLIDDIKELFSDQNNMILTNMPSIEHIKKLVRDALSQYDADKTGLTDFALESSGGSILTTKNTENYIAGAPMLSLFGIPLCSGSNSPRTIIQPSTLPGECWAFKGNVGTAVIKLLGKVVVTGVSLEHIPASISPTGELKTAPKEFSIWGLTSAKDDEGTFLGQFIYDIAGPSVQYFPIQNFYKAYCTIEFKIHSNHGNSEYTCVYRIRVHGKLEGYI